MSATLHRTEDRTESTIGFRPFYTVRLIHRLMDWDAAVCWRAENARAARRHALRQMARPSDWLIVSAKKGRL